MSSRGVLAFLYLEMIAWLITFIISIHLCSLLLVLLLLLVLVLTFTFFRASFDIASLFLFRVKSLYKFIMTMVCYVTEVHWWDFLGC